jgi:hypothetical protein
MDDPLENDVKRGPEEEVGDSEPGEPLQERERETSETRMLRASTSRMSFKNTVFLQRPSGGLPGCSRQPRPAGKRH